MKRIGFAVALGFAAAASGASAQELGPYVGLGLGLHMAKGTAFDYQEPPGTKVGMSDANFRLGFGVAAAAGYRWNDSMRLEVELSHRSTGLDNMGPEDAEGKQNSLSVMANVLFDIGVGENFHPYLGGGIGLSNNSWSDVETPTSPVYDDSQKKLVWQAIVGLELPVNARTNWFADYRYIGSVDNEFNTIPPRARAVGIDFSSHNVMVGVRHRF